MGINSVFKGLNRMLLFIYTLLQQSPVSSTAHVIKPGSKI